MTSRTQSLSLVLRMPLMFAVLDELGPERQGRISEDHRRVEESIRARGDRD